MDERQKLRSALNNNLAWLGSDAEFHDSMLSAEFTAAVEAALLVLTNAELDRRSVPVNPDDLTK